MMFIIIVRCICDDGLSDTFTELLSACVTVA